MHANHTYVPQFFDCCNNFLISYCIYHFFLPTNDDIIIYNLVDTFYLHTTLQESVENAE